MTGKDFAKKTAHFGLSASIIATKALKYGVDLSFGVTKCLLGGAKSLAKEFSGNSFNLCVEIAATRTITNGI